MKTINKKKYICAVSLSIGLYTAMIIMLRPIPARADGISLSTSPSLLQIKAIPPANVIAPIMLQNQGNNPLNIQISIKAFRPTNKENGQIEYMDNTQIPDNYKKFFEKIQLTDNGIVTNHFALGPQQKKTLDLQLVLAKGEPSSDYYFSIVFIGSVDSAVINNDTTVPTQEQNIATINAGIATNVLLSIGDQSNKAGYIEEFSTPTFIQAGPVNFTVRIKNAGAHVIKPKGIIFIKNIFGQTIGRIDIASANILAGTTRAFTDTQTAISNSVMTNPKAHWNEKFLLGPYTATLNLAVSDKGPIYNTSIHFLAVPIQLSLGIIVAICIIISVFLRVRYRLKTEA